MRNCVLINFVRIIKLNIWGRLYKALNYFFNLKLNEIIQNEMNKITDWFNAN
jgi:hypothetical protein